MSNNDNGITPQTVMELVTEVWNDYAEEEGLQDFHYTLDDLPLDIVSTITIYKYEKRADGMFHPVSEDEFSGKDNVASALFDLSLTHYIDEIACDYMGGLCLMLNCVPCAEYHGSTNITEELVRTFIDLTYEE